MGKRVRKFKIFGAMGICLWIFLFPTYSHFSRLEEADIFAVQLVWENPDPDSFGTDMGEKGKITGFAVTPRIIPGDTGERAPLRPFAFPGSFSAGGMFNLRC